VAFEVLHLALVLFCGIARRKRPEIPSPAGFGVFLSGIEPILAGF
jgi:hypothetical protein